jgi:DNA-binding transcriptional regulator YdaS (Cro superfamily)
MKDSEDNPDCPQATSASLSLKQHYAIELLLIGKTDAEVAALIGVDSEIVGQWQSQAAFMVAINALRAAAWEGSVSRLKMLMSRALDVVEEAVVRGDEMAAISFLQALGWQRDHH